MDPVLDEFLEAYTPEYVDSYRKEINVFSTTKNDENQEKLEILKQWFEEGLIEQSEYESEKNEYSMRYDRAAI